MKTKRQNNAPAQWELAEDDGTVIGVYETEEIALVELEKKAAVTAKTPKADVKTEIKTEIKIKTK